LPKDDLESAETSDVDANERQSMLMSIDGVDGPAMAVRSEGFSEPAARNDGSATALRKIDMICTVMYRQLRGLTTLLLGRRMLMMIACEGVGRRRMSLTSKNWLNEASQNSDPSASAQFGLLLLPSNLQVCFFFLVSASTGPAHNFARFTQTYHNLAVR